MGKKLWEDGEVHALLNYLSSHVNAYTTGVKEQFYGAAKAALDADGYTKTTTQIKTKRIELDSTYKTYKLKLAQSGFGVKESDSPGIKAMLQKKCPYYYEWDEIMGHRHNTTPPVIMEPGLVVVAGAAGLPTGSDEAAAAPAVSQDRGGVLPSPAKRSFAAAGLNDTSPAKRSFVPAGLNDALMAIHADKIERREKRHKETLELQKEQLELQREELRLREKKMDQQFQLMCKQIELERERIAAQRQKE